MGREASLGLCMCVVCSIPGVKKVVGSRSRAEKIFRVCRHIKRVVDGRGWTRLGQAQVLSDHGTADGMVALFEAAEVLQCHGRVHLLEQQVARTHKLHASHGS